MEPTDEYLLAVGDEKSITLVKNLNVHDRYLDLIQDKEHAEKRYYLFLSITNGVVNYASYIPERGAYEIMGPEYKVIINY